MRRLRGERSSIAETGTVGMSGLCAVIGCTLDNWLSVTAGQSVVKAIRRVLLRYRRFGFRGIYVMVCEKHETARVDLEV